MENQDTFTRVVATLGLGAALIALTLSLVTYSSAPSEAAPSITFPAAPESQEDVEARAFQTLVYLTNGGDKQVVASGGELEIQSGATLDIQAGATTDFSGGIDLDGGLLDLDADGDTSFQADTDDQIDIEIGGSDIISATATGLYLSGSTVTWDADEDTTAVASFDDVITYTLGAATGRLDLLTGNLAVGNGTPDTTLDGEDAYVEGTFEVDGAVNFDGAVDIDGNLTSATGSITVADTLNATGAVDFDSTLNVDSSINAIADVDVGTWLNLTAQSPIVVTEGAIITPTGTLQSLTSAAAVTSSTTTPIAAGSETDDVLILRNDNASDVITIDGTGGTVECKADIGLGAKDTLILLWNGSEWNCLTNYDNS